MVSGLEHNSSRACTAQGPTIKGQTEAWTPPPTQGALVWELQPFTYRTGVRRWRQPSLIAFPPR